VYIDEEKELEAVAFNDETGMIATCSKKRIYIYQTQVLGESVAAHERESDSQDEVGCDAPPTIRRTYAFSLETSWNR
jgi:hypothetical protein